MGSRRPCIQPMDTPIWNTRQSLPFQKPQLFSPSASPFITTRSLDLASNPTQTIKNPHSASWSSDRESTPAKKFQSGKSLFYCTDSRLLVFNRLLFPWFQPRFFPLFLMRSPWRAARANCTNYKLRSKLSNFSFHSLFSVSLGYYVDLRIFALISCLENSFLSCFLNVLNLFIFQTFDSIAIGWIIEKHNLSEKSNYL